MDRSQASLAERATIAAITVGEQLGLDISGHRIIRAFQGVLIEFPNADLIARVEPGAAHAKVVASTQAAELLEDCGVPAVRLAHPKPIACMGLWVSLWHRVKILPRPVTPEQLGRLAAIFHSHTRGRADAIRPYSPAISVAAMVDDGVGDLGKRFFALEETWQAQLANCEQQVLVHGDLHVNNAVWTPEGPLLLDLEDVGRGPACCDFVPAVLAVNRYGQEPAGLEAFIRGYGRAHGEGPYFATIYKMYELYVAIWTHHYRHVSTQVAAEAKIRLGSLRGHGHSAWTLI